MQTVFALEATSLAELRQRRAELRESMGALESALASPAVGRVEHWSQRVAVALVELSGDMRTHIELTEAPDGLHRDIAQAAPRLTNAVERLAAEHTVLSELLERVITRAEGATTTDDVAAIRDTAIDLLSLLARHRQRGADLIFEAFETDIGGET